MKVLLMFKSIRSLRNEKRGNLGITEFIMKLADLFLEILSQCCDEMTRDIAQSMKVALKTPAIAEVFDVCIVNSMGHKWHISTDTLFQAEQGFNDYNDFMLEKSNMSELQKRLEKIAYRHFCHNVFVALTCRLVITGQLES